MPGLHFLSGSPGQVSFSNPSPLLAVSILYVAAAHSPLAELAAHQPTYFRALTRAIGTLAVPDCPIRGLSKDDGEGNIISGRFDDLLGIILAGLLGVGFVDSLGMWVNTAFRLLLDGMTEERGKRQVEWHGLWEGLRVSSSDTPPLLFLLLTQVSRRSSSSTRPCTSSAPPCRATPRTLLSRPWIPLLKRMLPGRSASSSPSCSGACPSSSAAGCLQCGTRCATQSVSNCFPSLRAATTCRPFAHGRARSMRGTRTSPQRVRVVVVK